MLLLALQVRSVTSQARPVQVAVQATALASPHAPNKTARQVTYVAMGLHACCASDEQLGVTRVPCPLIEHAHILPHMRRATLAGLASGLQTTSMTSKSAMRCVFHVCKRKASLSNPRYWLSVPENQNQFLCQSMHVPIIANCLSAPYSLSASCIVHISKLTKLLINM